MIASLDKRGHLIVEYETQQEAQDLYVWYDNNFTAFKYTQLKIQAAPPQAEALKAYLAKFVKDQDHGFVKSGDLNIT